MAGTGRGYDKLYDWGYTDTGGPEPGPERGGLVGVMWDGLALNTGDQPSGLCSIISDVAGWEDSPPAAGNDAARSIADGSAWGPKVLTARTITLTGAVAGPRDLIIGFRDQLTARAVAREPAPLSVSEGDRTLTADVRADAAAYRHTWLSSTAYRWQCTLTAADPLLYEGTWQQAVLSPPTEDVTTGRQYAREFTWQYAQQFLSNTAVLVNGGNVAAPVWALYEGELSESVLSRTGGAFIRLARLEAAMQVRVATATLAADGVGGLSRSEYVLPGSQPVLIPPATSSRWHLAAAGRGSVVLAWRSAWA